MSIIDINTGKSMTEPEEPTNQERLAYSLLEMEECMAALCDVANRQPQLMRTARIELDGYVYGVAAFLRVIRGHMNFIEAAAVERKP